MMRVSCNFTTKQFKALLRAGYYVLRNVNDKEMFSDDDLYFLQDALYLVMDDLLRDVLIVEKSLEKSDESDTLSEMDLHEWRKNFLYGG